jgi:tripartite ATP-independent transporter DctP family solute receptor
MRASRLAIALALAVGLGGAGPAAAEEPIIIKLGTVAPEGTPWSKQIDKAKARIEGESKGRVRIKVYTGFAKGGENEIARRCMRGTLQMCGVTVGAVAAVADKDLELLELPYLFADNAEADRILDGPALPQVKKMLGQKGLEFYGWSENGWRSFGTRERPIRSPEDLKGLKMRSQESSVHVETYKALGANPVPISLPEVLGSLQRGVVDGYDQTELYAIAASWHQYTRFWTRSNHIYQPAVIVYNKTFIEQLPPDLRAIVMREGHEIATYGRALIRNITEPLVENLKSAGAKIIDLGPAEKERFVKATRGVHPAIRKRLTPEGKKLLDIIVAAKKK